MLLSKSEGIRTRRKKLKKKRENFKRNHNTIVVLKFNYFYFYIEREISSTCLWKTNFSILLTSHSVLLSVKTSLYFTQLFLNRIYSINRSIAINNNFLFKDNFIDHVLQYSISSLKYCFAWRIKIYSSLESTSHFRASFYFLS